MNLFGVAALLVAISYHKVVCDDIFTNITGSQVMFVDRRMTFDEAQTNCKKRNATLVEIWTLEEWNEITAWFTDREERVHRKNAVWIGLSDILEEGKFLWINGRPFSPQIGNVSWNRGQPNNLIGNQHCVGLYGTLPKMFDMSCGNKYNSVCQKRLTVVDPGDDHDGNLMDDNTIVHIVVSVTVIILVICALTLSVYCPRLGEEKERHSWKGLAIDKAEDTIPLQEREVESNSIAH